MSHHPGGHHEPTEAQREAADEAARAAHQRDDLRLAAQLDREDAAAWAERCAAEISTVRAELADRRAHVLRREQSRRARSATRAARRA
jgi:hypothetical protein